MENKQNDIPNLEVTREQLNQPGLEQEKTKKEIDPNNPTANQGEQNGAKENNQHPQDKTSTSILNTHEQEEEADPRNGNTMEREEEIREEEITDGIHGVTKPIKFPKEEEFPKEEKKEETESKTDNLYIKKGSL